MGWAWKRKVLHNEKRETGGRSITLWEYNFPVSDFLIRTWPIWRRNQYFILTEKPDNTRYSQADLDGFMWVREHQTLCSKARRQT